MYQDLLNYNVTIIVSSEGNTILEYKGTLVAEDENNIVLSNTNISYLILNFQKGFLGETINQYKTNVEKVILNKKYIISCHK